MESFDKSYSINDFDSLMEQCKSYVEYCKGVDVEDIAQSYADEFTLLQSNKDKVSAWDMLCNSGIFHDAIGKVVNYDNENVYVVTDY